MQQKAIEKLERSSTVGGGGNGGGREEEEEDDDEEEEVEGNREFRLAQEVRLRLFLYVTCLSCLGWVGL